MANNIVGLDVNLDKEYLKESVENIVSAAIMQALGEPHSIVKKVVDQTINQKVDSNGNPTSYSGTPYLQWLASKTVEKTVCEAMKELVEKHSPALKEEILSQVSSKKFQDSIVGAFIDAVLKSAGDGWRMPVSVSFQKPKDEDY